MYKRYEKYKDSGVEWIGEIPEHWKKFKVKQLFRVLGGNGFSESLQGREDGDYPFYKVSDINYGNAVLESATNYVDKKDVVNNRWNVIPAKSILMAKIGEALRKNHRKINPTECLIDNNMLALVPNPTINLWLAYYLFNIIDMEWFVNPGAVPSVNIRWFKKSDLFIMTKPEQIHMKSFLDHKTSEIDSLIADKEKLIEKLQKYKQSIITEAVTKGLNPDVKMKDSGIEWIGKIPEHWEIKSFRNVVRFLRNGTTASQSDDANLMVTRIESISNGYVNTNNVGYINRFMGIEKYKLERGDILFSHINSLRIVGNCALFEFDDLEMYNGMNLLQIRASENIYPKWLYYYVRSFYFNQAIKAISKHAINQVSVPTSRIKSIRITVPKFEEQFTIANYLDQKTSEIDALITNIYDHITKLKRYRQSLIYEAVTGKIDVRDYQSERSEELA